MDVFAVVRLINKIKPETIELVGSFIKQFSAVQHAFKIGGSELDQEPHRTLFVSEFEELLDLSVKIGQAFKETGLDFRSLFDIK